MPSIVSAVVSVGGLVFEGRTHGEAIGKALDAGAVRKDRYSHFVDAEGNDLWGTGWCDLFKTSDGRYIDRFEADAEFGGSHSGQFIRENPGRPDIRRSIWITPRGAVIEMKPHQHEAAFTDPDIAAKLGILWNEFNPDDPDRMDELAQERGSIKLIYDYLNRAHSSLAGWEAHVYSGAPRWRERLRAALKNLGLPAGTKVPIYTLEVKDVPPLVTNPAHYWGRSGAGLLLTCREEGDLLLVLRSQDVQEPGTWGIPGGSISGEAMFPRARGFEVPILEELEAAKDGAMREAAEELGMLPNGIITGRVVYRDKGFTYTTFVMDVSPEDKYHLTSNLRLNWENDEAAWFTVPEALALPNLHFGAKYVLERL